MTTGWAIRPQGLSRGTYALSALFGLAVAALAVTIWMVQIDARRQIDQLATANSDSTQWFLAQTEVEILSLQRALSGMAEATDPAAATADIRRRFDILYSRIQTLRQGAGFAALRARDTIGPHLARLQAMLDAAVPLIDAPDAVLAQAAPRLERQVAEAVPEVRGVSLEGVRFFALDSDRRREAVAAALTRLSLLVVPLFLVLSGTLAGLFWMFRAARLQTQRITSARNRLHSLFEASIDAILVAQTDGRILGYNSAAQRIYGYDAKTAVGADVVALLTPPDQRATVRALLAQIRGGARDASGPGIIRTTAQHQSGRIIPVELSLSVTADARDPLLVAFVRDVSRRAAEEAELIEARDRALAGQQAKARMIAVMSHEMRTPLNGVLGLLQLLRDTPLDARQARYLAAMEHSGQMLLRHINDVLDASRAGRDRIDLTAEPVDLARLLAETVESLRQQAEARGNRLVLDCQGATGQPVLADPARVQQIAVNLIGNAIKFTQGGQVAVELEQRDGMVELRVTDTGIGMAEEDLGRIFDAFVTLDPTFDRKVQGTGLGLSIVKGLVEAMGGTIDVASEPGQGTAFMVALPLPRTDRPVTPRGSGPAMRTGGAGLDVLVVEDNPTNRLVAGEMLRQEGCRVTEACDGLEGVRAAAGRRFDLILMDISMPGLNGADATRRIRAAGPNSATPIVALTAHAMDADLAHFREAGMDRVLVKPLQRTELARILHATPAGGADLAATLGPEGARALMDRIAAELRDGLAALEAGMTPHDACALVHRMAGSAAVGGLDDIRAALVRHERALRDAPSAEGSRDWSDLRKMLDRFRNTPAAKAGIQG